MKEVGLDSRSYCVEWVKQKGSDLMKQFNEGDRKIVGDIRHTGGALCKITVACLPDKYYVKQQKKHTQGERMHKVFIVLLCIVSVVVFGIASGMADDEDTMCIPMGGLTLVPPETVEAKRAPVDFPHTAHFEYACMTCHHQWTAEEPVQSCGTIGCHDLDTPPKPDNDDESILYFKKAFHKSCLGCHRAIKALNKKVAMTTGGTDNRIRPTGPTGCSQCHPK